MVLLGWLHTVAENTEFVTRVMEFGTVRAEPGAAQRISSIPRIIGCSIGVDSTHALLDANRRDAVVPGVAAAVRPVS
jgi:hypothetical protein